MDNVPWMMLDESIHPEQHNVTWSIISNESSHADIHSQKKIFDALFKRNLNDFILYSFNTLSFLTFVDEMKMNLTDTLPYFIVKIILRN